MIGGERMSNEPEDICVLCQEDYEELKTEIDENGICINCLNLYELDEYHHVERTPVK